MSTHRTHVQTGKSIFIPWKDVDELLNAWAMNCFGTHAYACGNRHPSRDVLEITLLDLRISDFETFARLYEAHDPDGVYNPEKEFHSAPKATNINSTISHKIVSELLVEYGMSKCGDAIPNHRGVLFVEKKLDGSDDPDTRYTVEGITNSAEQGWFRTTVRPGATQTAAITMVCPQGTIMAEVSGDSMYPGIYLVAKDDKGNERVMANLERSDDKNLWLYIYGDKESNSWTDRIKVEFPAEE